MALSPVAGSGTPLVGAACSNDELETLDHLRRRLVAEDRDVELQDYCRPAVLAEPEAHVERSRKLLDGHDGRLGIHGPFWGFTIDSQDEEFRRLVERRFLDALTVCEMLAATHMVVHSPYTTWDHHNLDGHPGGANAPSAREEKLERVHDTLREPIRRAEEIGCTLVVENIEDMDPHDRVRLVESFDSEALAVSIDTGHAHYAHGSNGAPPLDHYVHAAGERLAHVHLQDADGYADRHWRLGTGTIRWPAFFAALSRLSARPRLVIEVKDARDILPSWDWLQRQELAA